MGYYILPMFMRMRSVNLYGSFYGVSCGVSFYGVFYDDGLLMPVCLAE